MAAETMKEYLVKIGWNVDKNSLGSTLNTINKTEESLAKSAAGIAGSFINAGKLVTDVIIGINAQLISLVNNTAKLDYQTERLARQYWSSEKNVRSFSTALEVLGESYDSMMFMTDEQYQRFIELNRLGRTLEAPKELDDFLVKVRNLNFEFSRFKMILQYGSRWVVYWISQFTGTDVETFTKKVRNFIDFLIKNLPQITKKVAKFFEFFYRMGKALIVLIKGIGETIISIINIFDSQVTRVIAILGVLGVAMLKNPITWFIGAIISLLLLVDDYLGWKKGWKSALDWSKFDEVFQDLKKSSDDLNESLALVKELVDKLWSTLFGDTSKFNLLQKFVDGVAAGLDLISSALSDIVYFVDLLSGKNSGEGFLGKKLGIFDWLEENTGLFNGELGWLFGRGKWAGEENLFERFASLFSSSPVDTGMVTYSGNTSEHKSVTQYNNMNFNLPPRSDERDLANVVQEALINMRPNMRSVF